MEFLFFFFPSSIFRKKIKIFSWIVVHNVIFLKKNNYHCQAFFVHFIKKLNFFFHSYFYFSKNKRRKLFSWIVVHNVIFLKKNNYHCQAFFVHFIKKLNFSLSFLFLFFEKNKIFFMDSSTQRYFFSKK